MGDINSSNLSCSILFQSCSKRKRSAGARQLTGPDDKVFSTSKMIHILPGANSATTNLGILLLSTFISLVILNTFNIDMLVLTACERSF